MVHGETVKYYSTRVVPPCYLYILFYFNTLIINNTIKLLENILCLLRQHLPTEKCFSS